MQTAQVPLWVPLLVGVLGILGALGAQWLATRRDDRRWERESQREELRWRQELGKLEAEREHEIVVHWSKARLDVYKALVANVEQWKTKATGAIERCKHAGDGRISEDDARELANTTPGFLAIRAEIDFLSTTPVKWAANRLVLRVNSLNFPEQLEDPPELENAIMNIYSQFVLPFIDAVRQELGVEQIIATPLPPSDQTS